MFLPRAHRAQSLLVLGAPSRGKTTLLRDIARIMSTPPDQGGLGLAVLVVDTSNEICGEHFEAQCGLRLGLQQCGTLSNSSLGSVSSTGV